MNYTNQVYGYGPIAIADWSIMGFSVYWCSRWNGHIEYIETTAYGVYPQGSSFGILILLTIL
jgi:hypothetical protein